MTPAKTGRGSEKIRISDDAYSALKSLVRKAPQFSIAGLADIFIREAAAAAHGGPMDFPMVRYFRGEKHEAAVANL